MRYHITHLDSETPYTLKLRFADGKEGQINVKDYVAFTGIFEPLAEPSYFKKVTLHPIAKTPVWPNGCDLDPKELYRAI